MARMKVVRYVCTHCRRRFEAEEKETLECPGCFWSTTVKKEEDLPASSLPKASPASANSAEKKSSADFSFLASLRPLVVLLAVATGIIVTGIVIGPRVQQLARERALLHLKSLKDSPPAKTDEVDESGQGAFPGETLTLEEKNGLNRRLQVTADRPLSEEEEKILQHQAPFQTGIVERLPSQAWTFENFKQLIAEQEKFYKISLPSSYKKKLETLFKEKYEAAQEAFKSGDLIQARNLWLDSLAFPIYGGNVSKHRGVVLTMLKSFINDTLSKIGAINSSLVERVVREKETSVSESYGELLNLVSKKQWQEANAVLLILEQKLDELGHPELLAGPPPPYPVSIAQVDDGIREVLLRIQNSPPPAVADLQPVQQDVQQKRKVIESFLSINLDSAQALYDEAVNALGRGEWDEAERKLRQVETPLVLYKDAQEKIEILKKIRRKNNGDASISVTSPSAATPQR